MDNVSYHPRFEYRTSNISTGGSIIILYSVGGKDNEYCACFGKSYLKRN